MMMACLKKGILALGISAAIAGCTPLSPPPTMEPGSFAAVSTFVAQMPEMQRASIGIDRIQERFAQRLPGTQITNRSAFGGREVQVSGRWPSTSTMTGDVEMLAVIVQSCSADDLDLRTSIVRFVVRDEAQARQFLARGMEWGIFESSISIGGLTSFHTPFETPDHQVSVRHRANGATVSVSWHEDSGQFDRLEAGFALRYAC